MKRAYYPRPTMCITQGYDSNYTHQGTFAIDDSGEDGGIDWFLAPFDCVIKKILSKDYGNWVWIESLEKVECPNGYVGYLTMMFGHDNKVRHKAGDIIKEGKILGAEGTSGQATGNHNHIELGLGKYKGTWYENSKGVYMLYNAIKPNEYLYLKEGYVIKNGGGYKWTYEPKEVVIEPIIEKPIIEEIITPKVEPVIIPVLTPEIDEIEETDTIISVDTQEPEIAVQNDDTSELSDTLASSLLKLLKLAIDWLINKLGGKNGKDN